MPQRRGAAGRPGRRGHVRPSRPCPRTGRAVGTEGTPAVALGCRPGAQPRSCPGRLRVWVPGPAGARSGCDPGSRRRGGPRIESARWCSPAPARKTRNRAAASCVAPAWLRPVSCYDVWSPLGSGGAQEQEQERAPRGEAGACGFTLASAPRGAAGLPPGAPTVEWGDAAPLVGL